MSEGSKPSDIGVLQQLPEPLLFLAGAAIRFGSEETNAITETEHAELREIARIVREENLFHFVDKFLEEFSVTDFEECSRLHNLFRLFDRLTLTYRNYLLSFVTSETGQLLSIHLDLNGVNCLIETLEYIRDNLNDCPHDHLFADGELTLTKLHNQKDESKNVGHVKIYGWNDEWAKKHGLRPY